MLFADGTLLLDYSYYCYMINIYIFSCLLQVKIPQPAILFMCNYNKSLVGISLILLNEGNPQLSRSYTKQEIHHCPCCPVFVFIIHLNTLSLQACQFSQHMRAYFYNHTNMHHQYDIHVNVNSPIAFILTSLKTKNIKPETERHKKQNNTTLR